ncbi:MAG: DUF374 domain-containing protein [Planctomycetes bacterium]|nr:DUF374 domain-containing protein [Planctomycetota bacterium]
MCSKRRKKRKRFDILKLAGLISLIARAIITLIFRTSRFRIEGYHKEVLAMLEQKKPVIFVLWHNSIIGNLDYFLKISRLGHVLSPIASQSKDGEIISRIITDLVPKIDVIRGSSRKGAFQAFELLLMSLEDGKSVCITVDGPIGPKYESKNGALRLAALTGAPIVPIEFAVARELFLRRSWDNSRIPIPFNRGIYYVGKPIFLKNEVQQHYLDHASAFIDSRLLELTEKSLKYAKWRNGIF